ncbi:hypothetical protein RvY_02043 [Ramazzottius varieornatus]|uniref:RING-type domain-containing protein n=1 Tax=Ramazzottius varieornatus TaxID=947166 RepID=A0A1D1UIG3_RAMVA|nr:hypothetical protein RvY_02043 [Ramazzottius varieornatus]
MTPCQRSDMITLLRWLVCFFIYTVVAPFQTAHMDVVIPGFAPANQGPRNHSLEAIAISYGQHFPDDGLVVSLIGSRPDANEGCAPSLTKFNHDQSFSFIADNASLQTLLPVFTEPFALLLHRSKCHLRDTIRAANNAGYSAVIVYDHAYVDLAAIAIFDGLFTNVSLATFFLSFVDGRMLWRRCQYLSGCYVVINPSSGNINISLLSPSYVNGREGIPLNTSSSDIANVLLGFIPAVSYVCIVLSVLLIVIARRFFHCSLFVVYKIVMDHHPTKVAPGCAGSNVERSEDGSPTRCSICLDDIKSTDRIHSILPCRHGRQRHLIYSISILLPLTLWSRDVFSCF